MKYLAIIILLGSIWMLFGCSDSGSSSTEEIPKEKQMSWDEKSWDEVYWQ